MSDSLKAVWIAVAAIVVTVGSSLTDADGLSARVGWTLVGLGLLVAVVVAAWKDKPTPPAPPAPTSTTFKMGKGSLRTRNSYSEADTFADVGEGDVDDDGVDHRPRR